ncbi:MAG: RNA-binding S4 domain-containing protein [Alphaproteobacteria bacterium]|nr:RNA-binding S4 domain-containing protein [Alphaproteobacteria bacterium]
MSAPAPPAQRIDKWLWHARFFRTRSTATAAVASGHIRVSHGAATRRVGRASFAVRPGDILTIPQAGTVRVVRVVELAERRGPASTARRLYEEVAGVAGD